MQRTLQALTRRTPAFFVRRDRRPHGQVSAAGASVRHEHRRSCHLQVPTSGRHTVRSHGSVLLLRGPVFKLRGPPPAPPHTCLRELPGGRAGRAAFHPRRAAWPGSGEDHARRLTSGGPGGRRPCGCAKTDEDPVGVPVYDACVSLHRNSRLIPSWRWWASQECFRGFFGYVPQRGEQGAAGRSRHPPMTLVTATL